MGSPAPSTRAPRRPADPVHPPRGDARCAGQGDLFFPHEHDVITLELALALCRVCPISKACREYGIAYDVQGVWGGLDERQRRRIRTQRRVTPLPLLVRAFRV